MIADVLHGLPYHLLPLFHLYEVVQSRVELVMHLTRKAVKPAETCDGEDLAWKKRNHFQSSPRCYWFIQELEFVYWNAVTCSFEVDAKKKENDAYPNHKSWSKKAYIISDKRGKKDRFFSHLFSSTFYDSHLHRPHNIGSRSSACPQRVHLSVQQQQQAIYSIN